MQELTWLVWRRLRGHFNPYKYLQGMPENSARCFLVVPSARTRSNGHKLEHKKFHLNLRKNFPLEQLPREGMESPSLETFLWHLLTSLLSSRVRLDGLWKALPPPPILLFQNETFGYKPCTKTGFISQHLNFTEEENKQTNKQTNQNQATTQTFK